MAQWKNAYIKATEVKSVLILDDVDKEDSINPRSSINEKYVKDYEDSIKNYLIEGKDFSNSWGQVPEAVSAGVADNEDNDQEHYILTSGYHTITAFMNVIDKVNEIQKKVMEDPSVELSEDDKAVGAIDTDFEITVRVRPAGGFDPMYSARYFASFSNVHGQPLSQGEKSRAAYNALSVMNLTSKENDDSFRPHMNDRQLGALLGISKSTVHNQRQILIAQRYEVEEDVKETTSETASTDEVSDVVNELDNNTAPTIERQDGGTEHENTGDDRLPETGTSHLNVSAESIEDDDEEKKVDPKVTKAETLAGLRSAIDYVLEIDANTVVDANEEVCSRMETLREKYAEFSQKSKKDDKFISAADRIFSLFITACEHVANENELRLQ